MDFMNKKPTDADRFMQRVTSQHSSTSIFSNTNVNTSEMTPDTIGGVQREEETRTKIGVDEFNQKTIKLCISGRP